MSTQFVLTLFWARKLNPPESAVTDSRHRRERNSRSFFFLDKVTAK